MKIHSFILFVTSSMLIPIFQTFGQSWFTVKEIQKNVWQIDDHKIVNIYLIIGNDSALVVDTGIGAADLLSQIRQLTHMPMIVVNTHGHPDHTGANYQFKKVYIHPADQKDAENNNTPEARLSASQNMQKGQRPKDNEIFKGTPEKTIMVPLRDGQVFDLGGRRLQVMETPGHTPGEICLLDIENKLLFTGDNNNELVWLFLPSCRPLHEYLATLEKQLTRITEFTTILPGHGSPMSSNFIEDQIKCVKGILDKTLGSKPYESFAGNAMVSTYGRASVAFDPKNL